MKELLFKLVDKINTRTGILVTIGVVLLGLILLNTAFASQPDINIDNSVTNNYYGDEGDVDTNGCLCVTNGMSQSDVSKGLSLAMTAGAHELDFSTQDWQLSVTYALQVDEDEEGAYSAKLGKRWDKFGNALMHVTYVPEQGQDFGNWVIVGGTIRF